jgi:hypothetical protein
MRFQTPIFTETGDVPLSVTPKPGMSSVGD